MTRRAFPYTPFDNQVQIVEGKPRTRLPMDAPMLAFRNHYNTPSESRRGEAANTKGSLGWVVTVQTPHDTTAGGPGSTKPSQGMRGTNVDPTISSNTVTGGVVKGYITRGDSIRMSVLVSRNLFSPTSHASNAASAAFTAKIPPPAVVPSKDIGMPPKMGKRGTGGNFTIPAPQVLPSWPTSSQWLKSRFG